MGAATCIAELLMPSGDVNSKEASGLSPWMNQLIEKYKLIVRNSVPEIGGRVATDRQVRGYGSNPIAQTVTESPQGPVTKSIQNAKSESVMGTVPPTTPEPPSTNLNISEQQYEPEFTASLENFREVLLELQQNGYIHLADLTAYDESPASPRFKMVYELISMEDKKRCAVIVPLSDNDPKISTVTDIWAGANWLERETYDMFGIVFENHPDMRRILLPNAFKGYPLRKDFIVDYRQEYEKSLVEEGTFDPFGNTLVRGKTQS